MKNLMRDCKLYWIEIGEHENQSDQVKGVMKCEFKGLKIFQELEKYKPVKSYNCIETQFEKTICFLQFSSLLFRWVD